MIVCPVCEHAQAAASECEVCGRILASAGSPASDVSRLEGLEATRYDSSTPPPSGVLTELEPTAHARAAAGIPASVDLAPQLLEATRAAPIDVDVAPLADVERTKLETPADGPTALPAVPICRYCRTPAMPGERLCSRCGMRLPVFVAPASGPEATPGHVCGCGALIRGSVCPACGARGPG
jgi:hypothetical protein